MLLAPESIVQERMTRKESKEPHVGRALLSVAQHAPGRAQASYCPIPSCTHREPLTGYEKRSKLCDKHTRALSIAIDAKLHRYCNRCIRLHELGAFDAARRTCRAALAAHNAVRRESYRRGRVEGEAAPAAGRLPLSPAPATAARSAEGGCSGTESPGSAAAGTPLAAASSTRSSSAPAASLSLFETIIDASVAVSPRPASLLGVLTETHALELDSFMALLPEAGSPYANPPLLLSSDWPNGDDFVRFESNAE